MKYKTQAIAFSAALVLAALLVLPAWTSADRGSGPPKGAMTVQDPSAHEGMTPEQVERANKGEIVILDKPRDMKGEQVVRAAMMFRKNIDEVWDLITQGWRQEEYLPRLESSELVEKWDGGDRLKLSVDIMGIKINYQIIGDRDKSSYRSSWKLDPDYKNDMKQLSGAWQFYWVDDKSTFARYSTWVETKALIPDFVQEYMIKKDLPSSLSVQRQWIESGGTYKKEGYKPAGQ